MAKAPKPQPQADVPEETQVVTQEVTLDAQPETVEQVEVVQDGPVIEFFGEGADKVKFTINPNAKHYAVHSNGIIVETLK